MHDKTHHMNIKITLCLSLLVLTSQANAACPSALMILERTTNKNRVWYTKGTTPLFPITAKWEMREKGPGKWEELTSLEQNKAYGVRIRSRGPMTKFAIAGVQKIVFTMKADSKTGCSYVSYFQENGSEMIVQKIKMTMKKSLIPSATKVEFMGISMSDGKAIKAEVKL